MNYLELFDGMSLDIEGSKLKINNIPYTLTQFTNNIPRIIDGLPGEEKLLSLSVKDKDKYKATAHELFYQLRSSVPTETNDNPVRFTIPNLSSLDIVVDAETNERYVLDVVKNKLVDDISPKSVLSAYSDKERDMLEKSAMSIGRCIFNPMESRALYEEEGFTYLNKYTPPKWRYAERSSDEYAVNRFNDLLYHLFNNDESQVTFIYDWIYRLLTSRNETALVLNGFKGVGKNVLYTVCKSLVGINYCAEATSKFGVKEFNDILRDNILILIDEHRIDKGKYNFLKASFNEWQTIEAKGKAVKSTERIYTNYMIFHNSASDIYMENSERRFSVMDITEKKLTDIWSYSEIEKFCKDIENPDSHSLTQIGQYILDVGASRKQNPFDLWQGEKYKEILEEHIDAIIHSTIDLVENDKVSADGTISGKVINKHCSNLLGLKRATKASRAESLFSEYLYRGKYKLGKVLKHTVPWKLQVNPEILELIEKERREE